VPVGSYNYKDAAMVDRLFLSIIVYAQPPKSQLGWEW
jgi:hypothetical protein